MITSLSLCAVFMLLKRSGWPALMLVSALALAPATPSFGDIIYTSSNVIFTGTNAAGLSARATFTVDPGDSNVLRLLLENTSASPTLAPSELLTSIYFNVLSGTLTGTSAPLTYQSASGQVYLALKSMADKPATYVPPPPPGGTVTYPAIPTLSNLKAVNPGDNTWQFRNGMSLVASQPPLAFGVGTVGNSSLSPNNFNGNITGGFDFGIYKGDVTTQNLDGTLLVRDSANFAFAGFGGFKLSQISPHAVFAFGTNPECVISVPEPGALSLAAFGLLAGLLTMRRRRGAASASVQRAQALEIWGV
ncbi:MAG: XDD4 family exosortase-dependent surface protein [Planctomycetia bacterium]